MNDGPVDFPTGTIKCDPPNANLESWGGSIDITKNTNGFPVNIKNLILRGCFIRNTEYVIGVVVYIGHNTKIMKNAKSTPTKMTGVLKILNLLLYSIFGFQIGLILILAGLSLNWKNRHNDDIEYLMVSTNPSAGDYFIQLLTYWVTFSHLINISMAVVLQIIKLVQTFIINGDKKMYEPELKKGTLCRTSDLVEELGQIQFIFSDKTGTLTCNKMIFKKFYVGNIIYSVEPDQYCQGIELAIEKLQKIKDDDPLNLFCMTMALNHTVFPEIDSKGNLEYQASSPDEKALIKGACMLHYIYESKTSNTISLTLPNGNKIVYEILCELPFTPRNRMSVVVRQLNGNGVIYVLTKGADSSVIPICDSDAIDKNQAQSIIDGFAESGLRTLAFAFKTISDNEFGQWKAQLDEVNMSNDASKSNKIVDLYKNMENQMRFLGASAIEDKLQELVPETLSNLLNAGLRIWVLTGDKQLTAIKIGLSCNMISPKMYLCDLSLPSNSNPKMPQQLSQELQEKLEKEANKLNINLSEKIQKIEEYNKRINENKFAIVINGETISIALSFHSMQFFKLAMHSQAVICCRVSPSQKAQIVGLVKKMGKWTTLSIGDGANDVPMLLEAHVGIGVRGLEGAQAILASDYAICKFKYLQNMILFYGRCGYLRVSEFLCYYFYKNCICVFTEIIFVYLNGFSGQIFFYDMLLLLYNIVWSSLPCIAVYSLEFDINYDTSLKKPALYNAGPIRYYFNLKQFWIWLILSIYHGFASFGIPYLMMSGSISGDGSIREHWARSTVCFTVAFHVSTFKLYMETRCWHILNVYSI
jgi:phospholipid-transporting ATPase